MDRTEYHREYRRARAAEDPAYLVKKAEIQRRFYANHPKKEKHAEYRLKSRYGLTPDQYQQLYDKQEGCCAVCKRHQSEIKSRLVVDHDHKTSEIRALLCGYCNLRVIGKLRKDTIQAVYDYLMSEYSGWFVPKKKKKKKRRGRTPKIRLLRKNVRRENQKP